MTVTMAVRGMVGVCVCGCECACVCEWGVWAGTCVLKGSSEAFAAIRIVKRPSPTAAPLVA